jgi:tRNA modification GTPase
MAPESEHDLLHAAAQRQSHQQASRADLTLLCIDASRPLLAWDRERLASEPSQPRLVVWTKCDLATTDPPAPGILTSSATGEGLDELRKQIGRALAAIPVESSVVAGTADRCRDSLRLAGEALERALTAAESREGEEVVAAELRFALDELGRVAGAVYTEDVLDRVFSRFCIGK